MRSKAGTENSSGPQQLTAGEPLSPTLRHQMEVKFGADLSDVRVHSGHHAAALGAVAFTQGSDIHLQPDPHRSRNPDLNLIAHELAHVVQQRMPGEIPAPQRTFKPQP